MQLLLVDPDADGLAPRLTARLGVDRVDVTAAPNALAARAYLSGAAFDAVAVRDAADAAGVRALADVLGLSVAVHVYADEEALAAWLSARLGAMGETAPPVDPDAARVMLTDVRDELARLAHALNNPLAVVAGNAQLGREMALATGADADVVAAFENVDAGAAALGALLHEIGALRQRIDRALG